MWAGFQSYAEGMQMVIGLTGLKCWEKFEHYRQCSLEGGFRIMHEEFCVVSDFPEYISRTLHRTDGPTHRWRDGFEIYHLNSIMVPKWLVMTPSEKIDPQLALSEKNADVQREIIRKVGYERMLKVCNAVTLDTWVCEKTQLKYELKRMKFGAVDRLYMCYEHASIPGIFYAKPVPPETKNCIQGRGFQTGLLNRDDLGKFPDNDVMSLLPQTVQ